MTRTRSRPAGFTVLVQRLEHSIGLPLPAYQSEAAAGLDLVAAVAEARPIKLRPRQRALIPTGLVLELPPGSEAQVRPRSGLALRDGLTVLNAPGTIDSDYRGELQVLLINLGDKAVTIRRGDRIAQLVVAAVAQARLEVTAAIGETKRGSGGFGSTGLAAVAGKGMKKSTKSAPAAKPRKSAAGKPARLAASKHR